MKIRGVEGLSLAQVQDEVSRGAKFVIFTYNFSVIVMSFKRPTDVYFVKAGEKAILKGLPWTLLSLVVGWWGFPWGIIYTIQTLITNLGGGKNITEPVMQSLYAASAGAGDGSAEGAATQAAQGPQNWWVQP